MYDKISEWAAAVTNANVAHVIFLTKDIAFQKSLSKTLPDRVFCQLVLSDCSPEVAKRFVINQLDTEDTESELGGKKLSPSQLRTDLDELDTVLETLGGRLTDLELLVQRIKTGESPKSRRFPKATKSELK